MSTRLILKYPSFLLGCVCSLLSLLFELFLITPIASFPLSSVIGFQRPLPISRNVSFFSLINFAANITFSFWLFWIFITMLGDFFFFFGNYLVQEVSKTDSCKYVLVWAFLRVVSKKACSLKHDVSLGVYSLVDRVRRARNA